MALTRREVRTGARSVRVFVEGVPADTELYWYKNGGLVAVGKLPFYDFVAGPGEALRYFVTDDPLADPGVSFPYRARIEWERIPEASKYWVLQFVDGDFGLVDQVEAGRAGAEHWVSGVLKDDTLHYFAVDPVSAAGNEGNFRVFTVYMVRPPVPPAAVITWDAELGRLRAA